MGFNLAFKELMMLETQQENEQPEVKW